MANYTRIEELDSHYKQIRWGTATMPPCQHHLIPGSSGECSEPGEFDSPTELYGSWADLCYRHVAIHGKRGSTIGFHRIQQKG